jgi:hypothetical protein
LKVAILVESLLKEFVCDETGVWQSVHSSHSSEIDGAIAIDDILEVVLQDYFLWDIADVKADVLWSFHVSV